MNIRLIVLLFICFLTAFVACKKTNDVPSTSLTTSLNIINASTDSVNFYLNGSRLNSNSNLYPEVSSGYLSVLAGSQNFQVKRVFNPATSVVQQLFSLPLKLDTGQFYSLFIAGESASQAFITTDALQADTSTSTCLVRFVDASADANKYDLVVNAAPKYSGQAFGSASSFLPVDTGTFAPVALYQSGSATPVFSGTFTLQPGTSYTIFSTGKLNGTGSSALGLFIVINTSNSN